MQADIYTEPDFSSVALLTIDTQCDTLDAQPLEVAGTSAILPQMQRLLNVFRQAGKPIVHIVRIYKSDGSNVDLCRRTAIEQGAFMFQQDSAGCELAPALRPNPAAKLDCQLLLEGGIQHFSEYEAAIYKPRWGAFYNTPLEQHLQRLGISTLVFTGCNYPNCPRTSIYEASERDFRVVLVEDAVSGLYERGKTEMRNIGVHLMPAHRLINRDCTGHRQSF